MTDTDTATPAETVVSETPAADNKPKRYRATKAEMEGRERAALKLLAQAPITINALSTATNLPYAKAQALVQKLVADGRATAIGSDNGRTVYKLDTKAPAPPKPVVKLPERSFADFLNQFHVGQDLKVVGIHVTSSGTVVDMQAGDADVVKMTLAN